MKKTWLIIQREFLNRVQKKSFLVATLFLPLIFPALMGIMAYLAMEQKKHASKETLYVVDESHLFVPDTTQYLFRPFSGDLESAKAALLHSQAYGLLYIPALDLFSPTGIELYTRTTPSPSDVKHLETLLSNLIRDNKMKALHIEQRVLEQLKTPLHIETLQLTEGGKEESANTQVLFGIGMTGGILIYMFIFIYGAQIMQGVIEEKMSRVVEVLVSSVKPFQLMMGKILGLASVGLLQFLIWVLLITVLTSAMLVHFGLEDLTGMSPTGMGTGENALLPLSLLGTIPLAQVLGCFLFYFLGGYLLYGALFAAVGSAVDSPAEAQQFMFPISMPMLIAYIGLFTFILDDPHGPISFWLSIIPFTSPIAMMGRIAFGVPPWQLLLSMACLVGGFLFTTWIAGRIYRVGILMHGAHVSYRTLFKWFMMRG